MELSYRLATPGDLPEIIRLLSDDVLGAQRESKSAATMQRYEEAFRIINADLNQELTVAEWNGKIVGTFQLTYIQYLTYEGGRRAQVEAVRVNPEYRGRGIGTRFFEYAINRAREKGCHLLQLTTDKRRPEAIRFYRQLGFVATHEGMKLHL